MADLPLRETPPEEIAGVQDLFRETHEPSPWPRRVAFAGGIAALVSLAMFGWTQMRAPESLPVSVAARGLPPPRVPSNYCRCATRTMGIRSR